MPRPPCRANLLVGEESLHPVRGPQDAEVPVTHAWFANMLRAEREAVAVMLEERHERLLHEFAHPRCLDSEVKCEDTTESTADGFVGTMTTGPVMQRQTSDQSPSSSGMLPQKEPLSPRSSFHDYADPVSVAVESWRASRLSVVNPEDVATFIANLERDMIAEREQRERDNIDIQLPEMCPPLCRRFFETKFMPMFELFIAGVIVLNALVMAAERQYRSFDIGHDVMNFPSTTPSKDTWPGAELFFDASEWVVGCIFAFEVVFMFVLLRWRYLKSPWYLFDAVVVFFWVVNWAHGNMMVINPTLLRMAKLMRLVRLVRLVRFITCFGSLHILLKSIYSSMIVLFWSLCLLLLVIVVVSMIITECLDSWIRDESNEISDRLLVYSHWGSFSRSVETMFEITLGNWGPPVVLLQNAVSEWWVLFLIGYKCIIGFAVVQVITSVFIQQTFKVVSLDEEVMINEKQAETDAILKNLDRLFAVIDVSGDGRISQHEFDACFEDKRVRVWFAALQLDVQSPADVFALLDGSGKGWITPSEFSTGIRQLKGMARSVDMLGLSNTVGRIERVVKGMTPAPCKRQS